MRQERKLREKNGRLYGAPIERQSTTFWYVSWDESKPSKLYYPLKTESNVVRCVVQRTARQQTIHLTLIDPNISSWEYPNWKVTATTKRTREDDDDENHDDADVPLPAFPKLVEGHEAYRDAASYLSLSSTTTRAVDLFDTMNTTNTIQSVLICLMCGYRCYEYLHRRVCGGDAHGDGGYESVPRLGPTPCLRSIGTKDVFPMHGMKIRRLTDDELLPVILGVKTRKPLVNNARVLFQYTSFEHQTLRLQFPRLAEQMDAKLRGLAASRIQRNVRIVFNDPEYVLCRRRLERLFDSASSDKNL